MSVKQEIVSFLTGAKLKYRETDTHIVLDCFLCTDTRERLYIDNDSAKWKCFKCESYGGQLKTLKYAYDHRENIQTKDTIPRDEKEKKCTLKPNFHIPFHKNLKKTKEYQSAHYLKGRGITKEAILHFQLGARSIFKDKEGNEYDAGEHLAIPYLLTDGDKKQKCVNVKYRSLDPEVEKQFKWKREKGGITVLFNDPIIDNIDYDEIYIAESELDCISLWCAGIKNVIGLTGGAKGFKQAWYERLARFNKIYLVLDNDVVGQEGAEKLARRLGLGRCHNVILPEDVKDPNDYFQKYTVDDFKRLAKKSRQFQVRGARGLKEMMQNLYNKRFVEDEEETSGFDTPWPRVNRIIGPLKGGHLFVLAGKPKSGKSSIALNLMRYWGKKKIPSGMYSCEMNELRISEKFTMMEIPTLQTIEDATPLDIRQAMALLPTNQMEFYYPVRAELTGDREAVDRVCEKIKELVERYGLKIFVFDNLHFLCRGDDDKAMIDHATQQFKLLAEELEILFILVTHPRKTNNNKQLKTDDLKGSSSIFQDADLVWLQHRPMNDGDMTPDEIKSGSVEGSMSPRTEISITGRWTDGGKTFLAFNGARSLFKDRGMMFRKVAKEAGMKKSKPKKGL